MMVRCNYIISLRISKVDYEFTKNIIEYLNEQNPSAQNGYLSCDIKNDDHSQTGFVEEFATKLGEIR